MQLSIVFSMLVWACTPLRLSTSDFRALTEPPVLRKVACGEGRVVSRKVDSLVCSDSETQERDGLAMVRAQGLAELRWYEQGQEVVFPRFFVETADGTWRTDRERMWALAETDLSVALLLDYVAQHPEAPNRISVQLRLAAEGAFEAASIPGMEPAGREASGCSEAESASGCVAAATGARKLQSDAGADGPVSFVQAYRHSRFFVDAGGVEPQDTERCQRACACPPGAWNSIEVAGAYCASRNARLPTASEALGLFDGGAESSRGLLTTTPFQPAPQRSVRETLLDACVGCDVALMGPTVVGPEGLLRRALPSSEHGFVCVREGEPEQFPVRLTERPVLAPRPRTPHPASYGARDAEYRGRVVLPRAPQPLGVPAFDYGYKDVFMVADLLWAYHSAHPDRTRLYNLGWTREGYPLLALQVSGDPDDTRQKPSILVNGSHHGDELLPVLVALRNLDHVLGPAAEVEADGGQQWLDQTDLWFVPLVNPDGNLVTLLRNRGPNLGRKNGADTDGNCLTDQVKEGVDLNRNYPFRWGAVPKGSSDDPLSNYYRGPDAASEPETRALLALAEERRFVAALSWHTNGTMILSPYTIPGVENPSPDLAWEVAEALAARAPVQPNGRTLAVKRSMYPVDGTDQDWHFHQHGTLAYIVEGSHHNPLSLSVRQASVEALNPVFSALLDWTVRGPSVSGRVVDDQGTPIEAWVQVVGWEAFEGEMWTSRPSDGFFFRYLPPPDPPDTPGEVRTVTLEFRADGKRALRRTVNHESGPVRLEEDVVLLSEP